MVTVDRWLDRLAVRWGGWPPVGSVGCQLGWVGVSCHRPPQLIPANTESIRDEWCQRRTPAPHGDGAESISSLGLAQI